MFDVLELPEPDDEPDDEPEDVNPDDEPEVIVTGDEPEDVVPDDEDLLDELKNDELDEGLLEDLEDN